jgi:hypothetical protein
MCSEPSVAVPRPRLRRATGSTSWKTAQNRLFSTWRLAFRHKSQENQALWPVALNEESPNSSLFSSRPCSSASCQTRVFRRSSSWNIARVLATPPNRSKCRKRSLKWIASARAILETASSQSSQRLTGTWPGSWVSTATAISPHVGEEERRRRRTTISQAAVDRLSACPSCLTGALRQPRCRAAPRFL